MVTRRKKKNKSVPAAKQPEPTVHVAELMDEADDLAEESELLLQLSLVLHEYGVRNGQPPSRQLLLDGRRVTPQAHVLRRIQTMLSVRSTEVRDRARRLLELEVPCGR